MTIICKQCGIEFINYSHKPDEKRMFCSNECRKSFRKGRTWEEIFGKETSDKMKIFTQEHKDRISEGVTLSQLGVSWEERYGKEHTEKMKIKASERISKEKNFFWLNGKTKSLEYDWTKFNLKFKNQIRKRDNQICMNCGIHREKLPRALDIHHIDYNEKNTIEQNCISLCRNCHGLTQLNREYWIKLFQEKLSKSYGYKYSEKNEVIINV